MAIVTTRSVSCFKLNFCFLATYLKHKEEIFGLVCRDFPDYEWSLRTLDRGFLHIEIFRITKIHQYTLCLRQFMLKLIVQESYKNKEH